ncbi:hypothetical protein Hanom_Chr15g01390851 [Helianthus anomalus]
MSRTGRSLIRSILTKEDLESFIATYQIPSEFSPSFPGPDDPADCTPERIALYTLSFSFCDVRYPLSPFKVAVLNQYGIHFSQLHPLALMRIVHFKLSCVAVSDEPSVPLFRMFYQLKSDGYWFTFDKRKDRVSLPCYSFIPTSTYPKEWNNMFIFVSASLIQESPPLRDPKAFIDNSVPTLSANETVLWKRKYEHPIRAFKLLEGILAMGGLSPFYLVRLKAYCDKKDMGNVLEGKTPDVGSSAATEEVEKTPSSEGGSQRGPRVLRTPPHP